MNSPLKWEVFVSPQVADGNEIPQMPQFHPDTLSRLV